MNLKETNPIRNDIPPYSAEAMERQKKAFFRDGFLLIPDVLDSREVEALKTGIDKVFADERWERSNNVYGKSKFVAVRLFETDPVFEDMLTREPIISLVENILGPDCHLIAENVVRNAPGQSISKWHADDAVVFPVGEGMDRHDPRMTMPVFILTIQILLTDVPSLEYGATQYVPGSHYSGRNPPKEEPLTFEGREPVTILGKAGDIYLHNGQCWHRGSPNTSTHTRYLFQITYGQRWVSQRFYPFVNYQLPAHVLERADERRKRILGIHPKGAYG